MLGWELWARFFGQRVAQIAQVPGVSALRGFAGLLCADGDGDALVVED